MFASVLTAVLAVFVAYCIRWRIRKLKLFSQLNIPGPAPNFFFGNLWDIYRFGHLEMQKRWHERYGPVIGYYLGMSPVVLVSDTDLLKQILLRDFHKFTDRPDLVNGKYLDGVDDGLTRLKGQRWRQVRAILTPAFTTKKLKQINPMMCSCVDTFMENVDKAFRSATAFEIYDCYQALTLDSICRIGMGLDLKIQDDVKNSKYLRMAKAMVAFTIDLATIVTFSLTMALDLFGRIGVKILLRMRCGGTNPVSALQKQCRAVVKLRRSNPDEYRRSDLLQLMMDAQSTEESSKNLNSLIAGATAESMETAAATETTEKGSFERERSPDKSRGLTDSELIDSAFTMLIAGYETTSSSLAYLTKMLLRFPEVQERVRAELMEATDGGKTFNFERLQRCGFTEAVIQETLRMYPPVFFFTGRVVAEDTRYGKMIFPKGMIVFSSLNELHYNEKVFPNAREFRPERFLPSNKTPAMTGSYQPFGAGPRNCIGMRFAQMEIKVTLAKLLTKYRLSSAKEPKHESCIRTKALPIVQQIKDPLECTLELL